LCGLGNRGVTFRVDDLQCVMKRKCKKTVSRLKCVSVRKIGVNKIFDIKKKYYYKSTKITRRLANLTPSRNLSSKTKSGVRVVGLDKRRKPASIAATAKPTNHFTLIYEDGTCTPRPAITGDLLLTNFLSQQAAALLTPRELTTAAKFERRSAVLSSRCKLCSLNHNQAPGTCIINSVCVDVNVYGIMKKIKLS